METFQLGSSSDDDDDMYLNSVAKLNALKKKPPPPPQHNDQKGEDKEKKIQKNNKEILEDTNRIRITRKVGKQKTNQNTRGKRNTTRHRLARQRQKRNAWQIDNETDSDLEIVSIEEKPISPENDLFILESSTPENLHSSETEDYEINIKILWRSKNIHRLNICKNENFRQIFEYFANLEQVSTDEILITKKDVTIKQTDTPASINLSVIDILEGGIVKRDGTDTMPRKDTNNENVCTIKIQTTGKKNLTVSVKRDDDFKILLEKCAQKFDVEQSKIKLYFDGELISATDTPDSLDIEDEACFDLRLSS
ncbi:DNA repair protein Rad60 isoform X2 [Bombus fervidus]|uniref:DNA repair protein Rad60 isoform X2 n=1 Tax=Bombus fervidus TaxID=203811 RepID=UPI003AB214A7